MEIARLLGVSKQRVEQIERQAVAHALALLAEQGICDPSELAPDHYDYLTRSKAEPISAGVAAGIADMTETDTGDSSGTNNAAQDAA